jgi:hypothetical protein
LPPQLWLCRSGQRSTLPLRCSTQPFWWSNQREPRCSN